MSLRSRYHTRGPSWAVRLNSDPLPMPAAPIQVSALDLPAEQKFALVYLRKQGPESLAAKIIKHLDEAGIPFPTGHHWRELRSDGYVTPAAIGHTLTPKGHRAAEDIMRDLAFKYEVHHFIHTGGRGTHAGQESRCTCRQFHCGPHTNTRAGDSRIASAERAHLRAIESGTWRRQSLTDFLNKYQPMTLNFSGGPENGAAGLDGCTPTAAPTASTLQQRTS